MKKIKLLLFSLLLLFVLIPNVEAITIDNLATANDEVTLTKKVKGTGFTAGNTVNLKNEFDGISFVAGNTINDSSKSDYAFIAGNNINLNSIETKDLFVAGNNIVVDSDKIERDIYIAGNNVTINGNIGRNVYTGGTKVIINGNVSGNLVISADTIEIGEDAVIGSLKYNDNADIKIKNKSNIEKIKTYKDTNVEEENIKDDIMSTFELFLNLLLVGYILLSLFKGFFKKIEKEDLKADNVIKNILIGLGILVAGPICIILLLISTIGISLALLTTAIYIITIYLSSIFTGYYFSKKLLSDKIKNDYLLLLIGIFTLYVVRFIPVIGGIITALSLFFGIGIFIKTNILLIKKK